jgi:hypothetical protein
VVAASWISPDASANAVVAWNQSADRLLAAGGVMGNARARALAMIHVAIFEAVNAIDGRYAPYGLKLEPAPGASADAAAAAAAHGVLSVLAPSQKAKIDEALADSLRNIPEGVARVAGIALGEKAATGIIVARADDALTAPDTYRPHTTPGIWVPTATPISPEYATAKPWGAARHDTYRPGPPPALKSEQYARDYNETRSLGGRNSATRTAEQVEAVRFWSQANLQASVDQVARQYVEAKKLDLVASARLYALMQMANNNTFIADWDAKFVYNFWRPVTAIRNGDQDGNDATEREPAWTPFNATPMHPEYPSQAAIVAAIIRGIIEAEFGTEPLALTIVDTANPALKRSFKGVEQLGDEMCDVRIWGGIHFRTSLNTSREMGRRIAADLVASQLKQVRR